jgi:hypothetical protein
MDAEDILPLFATLWEVMDGCAKQYRCATALYFMSVLAYRKSIRVDRMIQATHHGKGPVDSQNGVVKNKCRRHFNRTKIPEIEDRFAIDAHTVEANGKRASFAGRIKAIMDTPDQIYGVKGDVKHEKREQSAKISKRCFHVMHHGNTDSPANAKLDLINTKFGSTGFISKSGQTQNGIMAHYHFVAFPELGIGRVAARRIPCACEPCCKMLKIPWDNGVTDPQDQPRFATVTDCKYALILGDLNDWRIIYLKENPEVMDVEELEQVYNDILGEHEAAAARNIAPGGFGAYGADEYHLVEWKSEAFPLEKETDKVEGMAGNVLPAGTLVAKGVYWNDVGRAPRWYTPPSGRRVQRLFRVRYVVSPQLVVNDPSDDVVFPRSRKDRNRVLKMGPKRVTDECHGHVLAEVARRARLDHEEDADADGLAIGDCNDEDDESVEYVSGDESESDND